ncbi:hypothetical protein [Streptomyces sp. OR43]|uniref:hypothetical protein n=1 Tax=Streptomyces sp. or43 TaxID=2478957 RepID=UPI0011CD7AC2|nr:hypothetical protein [Streptomyces sp. or43]TXS35735.1 hypothetical protein EAO72_19140 [Streptomyces sp. or43]
MELTHYQWTATGTRIETGEPCDGSGAVEAENPRDAEAMVLGFCKGQGIQPDDIVLTYTRNS